MFCLIVFEKGKKYFLENIKVNLFPYQLKIKRDKLKEDILFRREYKNIRNIYT